MRKSNGESSLVTTEEAKEITAEHRTCRDVSWEMSRSTRGDHTEQTFTCYGAPEDEFGMTTKGLLVEGTYTFGMKTKREKITLTLWQNDKATRSRDRVVQLESRRPLNKKGKQSDLNWPHIHFGKERTAIDESELGATVDVARAAKMFGEKSNISFDPELQDPYKLMLLP
jgi:hypothetical protein